ncbi:MAG: hypothetical protein IH840_17760 [Candidatus Heimdallarchaeota archaeon]|nr:hypothetical protein [Candidatus Heimdallarchaeota archaeon]
MIEQIGIHAKVKVDSHRAKESEKKLFIYIPGINGNKRDFLNYLDDAKLINQARKSFPHKFDHVKKSDLVAMLMKTHPEYFDSQSKLTWEKVVQGI